MTKTKAIKNCTIIFAFLVVLFLVLSVQEQVSAVQPTSTPAQNPTATPSLSLEERLLVIEKWQVEVEKKLEQPQKDVWDKIESVSGLVSGGVIALVGILFTYFYQERQRQSVYRQKQQELSILHIQTVQAFMPQLESGKESSIEASLLAISSLGNIELVIRLSELFNPKAGLSALIKILRANVEYFEKVIPSLLRFIQHESPEVRRIAAEALGELTTRQTLPQVLPALLIAAQKCISQGREDFNIFMSVLQRILSPQQYNEVRLFVQGDSENVNVVVARILAETDESFLDIQSSLKNLTALDNKQKRILATKVIHIAKKHLPNNFSPGISTSDVGQLRQSEQVIKLLNICIDSHDPILSTYIEKYLRNLLKSRKLSTYLQVVYATVLKDVTMIINLIVSKEGHKYKVYGLSALGNLRENGELRRFLSNTQVEPSARIRAALELVRLGKIKREEINQVVKIVQSLDSFSLSTTASSIIQLAEILEEISPDAAVELWAKLHQYHYILPKSAVLAFKRLKSSANLLKIIKESASFDEQMIQNPLISEIQKASDAINAVDDALQAIWEIKDVQSLQQIVEDNAISLHLRSTALDYLKNLQNGLTPFAADSGCAASGTRREPGE